MTNENGSIQAPLRSKPAPTQEEFQNSLKFWTDLMVPMTLFKSIQKQFSLNLTKDPTCASGYLISIDPQVFSSDGETNAEKMISYLTNFEAFLGLKVPLHWYPGGCNWGFAEFSFYQLAGHFTDPGLVGLLIQALQELLKVPQIAPYAGKALATAIMNGARNLLLDDVCGEEHLPVIHSLIVRRMLAVTQFLTSLCPLTELSEYHWVPAASDPHCGGKQAVFLLAQGAGSSLGHDLVLKPHSLAAENAVLSPSGGLIDLVNHSILTRYGLADDSLPTLQFPCVTQALPQGGFFGLEHLVQKVSQMDLRQASHYFVQMGRLLFLAKLWGMSDLHQDNVMPTQNGPLIVDGECVFDRSVIRSRNLNATLMRDSILRAKNIFFEESISGFSIDGEYSNQRLAHDVRYGFQQMQQVFHQPQFAQQMQQVLLAMLERQPTIRIVPVSTSDLTQNLISFHQGYASEIVDRILSSLPYSHQALCLDDQMARRSLENAFSQGDIPIFQIQVTPGRLSPFLINGQEVGKSAAYLEPQAFLHDFQENLQWLLGLEQKDIDQFFHFS